MSNLSGKHQRLYLFRMSAIFFAYSLILLSINWVDRIYDLAQWQRVSLALLPLAPAVAMVFAILSFLRSRDEVWQRIISEAAIVAGITVGLGTFALGFLGEVIELPATEEILIWIWPAMIGIQGLAMPFVRLRYT